MDNRKIKILAIDDNPDNLISLKALLEDVFPNASIFTALTGEKGLELASTEDPDVILLDIIMPIMDGLEVCRRLKADCELREIPVVFVTAIKGDKENRILALESGAEAFLSKPIDESELTAQIRAMLKIRAANIQKSHEKERLAGLVEEKTSELRKAHLTTLNLLEDLKRENEVRRNSERALFESEEKYRRIAENVSDVVWTLDLNLNLTYVSPSIESLTGVPVPVYVNRTMQEKYSADSIARFTSVLIEELEKEKDPKSDKNRFRMIEVETYRADRSIIWISMNISYIRDKNGKAVGILGVSRDITDRKRADEALKSSEEKYRLIAENVSDVIWILNVHKDRLIYISPSIISLRGITVEEAINESIEEALTPDSALVARDMISKCLNDLKKNHPEIKTYTYEVKLPCKNGNVIWVEQSINGRYNSVGEIEVLGISRNIDSRKKQEEKLKYLSFYDQLTGLYNRRYFEEALIRLDTERNLPITIVMGDINGLKLVNDSFGHAMGDLMLKKVAETIKKGIRNEDIVSRLGGDEFVIILPNTDSFEAEQIIKRIKDQSTKETVGSVSLSISFGYEIKRNKEENIQEILIKAEDSMYRYKLYESKSLRSKTIDVIMNALIEKSSRELMHSKRVSTICEAIATKLNFEKEYVNQIRIAGLVHDIGKIGINETILNKSQRLDKDDWEAIKKHPEAGWRILHSVIEFSELAEFVLSHHERWDGKGYPRALKGDEIAIEARIIAIADSYDAMTSDRSYRKGMSEDEAKNEIWRCSGTQFDPEIVKVFIEKVLGYKIIYQTSHGK